MAFTATDLANVDAALVSLARGQRTVRITIADKSTEFANVDIDKLRAFRDSIAAEISTDTTPRFFLTTTSKGL